MNTVVIAASLASLFVALPAAADPVAASTPAPAATESSASAAAKKPTKYCFETTTTGTRIGVTECRTQEEWARAGVKVPAKYLR